MSMPGYQLYCDMDGVLTDFEAAVQKVHPKWIQLKQINPEKAWNLVKQKGAVFFAKMKWNKGGQKLWNFIKENHPIILTAHPRGEGGKDSKTRAGKTAWVAKNLGNWFAKNIKVVRGKEKKYFADAQSILIDDSRENIAEWVEVGGIGILHRSTPSTINKLEKLLESVAFKKSYREIISMLDNENEL